MDSRPSDASIETLAGFIFIYTQIRLAKRTYIATIDKSKQDALKVRNDQLWKKAQFVASQASEFFSDKRVEARYIYA